MKFPLAGKLGFFAGPPGKNKVYEYFNKIESMIEACDDVLNLKLARLKVSNLTVVSVDPTNVPVDKRDTTGAIGTGSQGSFFGHKISIAAGTNCVPLSSTVGPGHQADATMFVDVIKSVIKIAKDSGQEIWCEVLDAGHSTSSVVTKIEGMNAIPFVDINPKNSRLLKQLKMIASALMKYSRKAWKSLTKEEKRRWRERIRAISEATTSPIPLHEKKRILQPILRALAKRASLKGLTLGERQVMRALRRKLMAVRREIRMRGTASEKLLGLTWMALGTVEWLAVYSIRGQNEGINGILKKRGALIGEGQHTTWVIGSKVVSHRVYTELVGIKMVSMVKFMITKENEHHLCRSHNWKRRKAFFCAWFFSRVFVSRRISTVLVDVTGILELIFMISRKNEHHLFKRHRWKKKIMCLGVFFHWVFSGNPR
jgi:hypothetical protein